MPTENPRIQVMLDAETSGLLASFAALKGRSVSGVAADFIREALELQEDAALSAHGDARLTSTQTWHTHEQAWGQ